jgi:hypothetical protein
MIAGTFGPYLAQTARDHENAAPERTHHGPFGLKECSCMLDARPGSGSA